MRAPSTRAAPFVLAGLVLAAAIGLALLGRGIATPWILIDKLLHAGLARGLRAGDGYSVRGYGFAWSDGRLSLWRVEVHARPGTHVSFSYGG